MASRVKNSTIVMSSSQQVNLEQDRKACLSQGNEIFSCSFELPESNSFKVNSIGLCGPNLYTNEGPAGKRTSQKHICCLAMPSLLPASYKLRIVLASFHLSSFNICELYCWSHVFQRVSSVYISKIKKTLVLQVPWCIHRAQYLLLESRTIDVSQAQYAR